MSKTTFSNKCEILGDLWLYYREDIRGNEAWEEFFAYNDVALPLAYILRQEYATISEEGEAVDYINETWEMFCDYISVDSDGEYSDLTGVFEASPNKPLEKV